MRKSIITGLVVVSIATTSLMAFDPNKDGERGCGNKPKIFKVIKQPVLCKP